MKTDFDALLSQYRERAIPGLPASFGANVRREIRLRAGAARSVWWEDALDLVRRPGSWAAALTAAVVIGLIAPGLQPTVGSNEAAKALGMEVFSSRAASFPTGLLALRR